MGERKYPWFQEAGWDRGGGKLDKFLGPRGYSQAPRLPGLVSMAISPLGNYNPISSQPDDFSRSAPKEGKGWANLPPRKAALAWNSAAAISPWPPRRRRAQIVKTLGMSIAA